MEHRTVTPQGLVHPNRLWSKNNNPLVRCFCQSMRGRNHPGVIIGGDPMVGVRLLAKHRRATLDHEQRQTLHKPGWAEDGVRNSRLSDGLFGQELAIGHWKPSVLLSDRRPRYIGDPLNSMPGGQLRDQLGYLLFDLSGKTDMNTIAAMERLLQTDGITGISGNDLEGAVKQLAGPVRIPGHDPHSESSFFQAASHRLAQQSGPTDN